MVSGGTPPEGLATCEIDGGNCAICDRWTRFVAQGAHVHLCSAACLSEAADFLKWAIEQGSED